MADWTEAGKGEYHAFTLPGQKMDKVGFVSDQHYIAVDASSWYLNKESSFWTERTASGTLEIVLYNGLENYKVPLGNFELQEGAKTAPVFDNPVLPDRYYRGAPLTFKVSLLSFKKDTALGAMLKGAADAGLGIVKGMVETATREGPSRILGAAGGSLFDGVHKLLASTDRREAIFDPATPLEKTLQEADLFGPEMYVLLHRGAKLDPQQLTIKVDSVTVPVYGGKEPLRDGAWLLLRVRRSEKYSGVRSWDKDERSLKQNVALVVADFAVKAITKEQALAKLKPAAEGQTTLWSDFEKLKVLIAADPILTQTDASIRLSALYAAFASALGAVEKNQGLPSFTAQLQSVHNSLANGMAPDLDLKRQIVEIVNISNPDEAQPLSVSEAIISSMKYMRTSLADSFAPSSFEPPG